jgi:tight adherence protein C
MYFYIIIASVFVSVFILILAFGLPAVLKKTRKSKISKIVHYGKDKEQESDEVPSFSDRVLRPFFSRIASVSKKMGTKELVRETNHKLELAGIEETVGIDEYLALKLLLPFGFIFIIILEFIFLNIPLWAKLFSLVIVPISYFFPDIFLRSRIQNRQEEIRVTLPNALDLMTISIEAGMGFNIAVSRVADNIKGPLGEEFKKMLNEIQIGFSRRDAFKNLDRRTDVADLSAFVVSMIQADVFGIPVGRVLRVQASEMRIKRRQRAEEYGYKAPIKLIFPVLFCLFPSLLTVVIGPGAIQIYEQLFKAL